MNQIKERKSVFWLLAAIVSLFLIVFVWLTISTSFSRWNVDSTSLSTNEPPGFTIGTFFQILLVFGIIYTLYALAKWYQRNQPAILKKRMMVLETIRLSQKQSIYLVKIDSKEFLIGGSDQSLQLISEIPVITDNNNLEKNSFPEEKSFQDFLEKKLD
ncbi:MAG: FliO/MopB family protein [Anaerolineaceae bacterium]|nr:FliO/MopB family protein [Anaerolineaceae bacterium]